MDSAVPSECCVCGVPIGVKGGVGGTLQSTSGLWICFGRRCWKQHEAVFCPDNERLMEILNRRRDAESDARMAAHLYADALEHATKADTERDAALKQRDEAVARAEKAEAAACQHGWRGHAPEDGARIVTPCPSCGSRSLFIGTGGHLTCSVVPNGDGHGCPEPGVQQAVESLRARAERAEEALRWYADQANYHDGGLRHGTIIHPSIYRDAGAKAREALGGPRA